jgi:methionine salvage enolase-phosphatase E1
VIVAILTDGLENASQEFKRKQIFKMIKHQREAYSWEFIFLGANQDAIHAATQIGVLRANAVTFSAAPGGAAQAFQAISRAATAYRAGDADYAQHLSKAAKKEKD